MSLPSKRFMTLPLALLPLLLGACVATTPLLQDDTRLQQLLVGMDQCLESQAAVSAQLIDQQRQLEQQNQQLSALQEARVLSDTPGTSGTEVCTPPGNASGKILVGELEQELSDAITRAFEAVTPADVRGWFFSCHITASLS